jgi:adenylosuccinate lyase
VPVHPIDHLIQANVFSTPELQYIHDEKTRIQRWLDFEAALAETQAELGIIPAAAALEIRTKADLSSLDLTIASTAYQTSRNSLLPALKMLRAACTDGHGEYVHFGATTQDVIDTGMILELKDALNIIYRDLRKLEQTLLDLSRRYQHTPMIGRTHGQQALPITLGMKTAIWLSEIRRHIERLKYLAPRLFVGQLSGAVGTMAALGPKAEEVAASTLQKLGLRRVAAPWHTSRDMIAETAACLALFASSFEKIGNEIFQLNKNEINELGEPAPATGTMSSSTMPHKKNPVLCQRICVLGSHVRSLTTSVFAAMVHEHERDARALWSEWLAMPQISIYTGTALHYLVQVMAGLTVNEEQMATALREKKDVVCSEWLLFKLAEKIGKASGQKKLHQLLTQAGPDKPLRETLLADPDINRILGSEDLDMLDHPEQYTGRAAEIVEDVIQETIELRNSDPEILE